MHFSFLTHYQFHYFIKQALQNAILHMFGPSGVLPRVLPFTQFYPGFTQLPRIKLGKTVLTFYPPTLPNFEAGHKHTSRITALA